MKEYIEIALLILSTIIELITGIIILTGLINYFRSIFTKSNEIFPKVQIRLALGRSFAVTLELLLGADIIKTACFTHME